MIAKVLRLLISLRKSAFAMHLNSRFVQLFVQKIKLTLSPDASLNKELKQIATAYSQQNLPSKH
tara:strand:+ start:12596 stop:12787 length:192 start_codon:yes stop_codon:yes gene_type:complete